MYIFSLFVFLSVTTSFILVDNYQIVRLIYLEVGGRKLLRYLAQSFKLHDVMSQIVIILIYKIIWVTTNIISGRENRRSHCVEYDN